MQPSRAYFHETFLGIRTGCRNVINIPPCILGACYFISKYSEYSPSADFTGVQFIFLDKIRYNAEFSKKNCAPVNFTPHYADFSKNFPHSSEFYITL